MEWLRVGEAARARPVGAIRPAGRGGAGQRALGRERDV